VEELETRARCAGIGDNFFFESGLGVIHRTYVLHVQITTHSPAPERSKKKTLVSTVV
jgi:hypothetical protein